MNPCSRDFPTRFSSSRLLGAAAVALMTTNARADLEVTALGMTYSPDPKRVSVMQNRSDAGGNTSVRNFDRASAEWKSHGYFQRSRDLGQTFTPERDFTLDAIVLRTGPADLAVLAGTPGAKVFVQFFEVIGEPRIDDNGTPTGAKAKHGFNANHRCDDFLTGVTYKPIRLVGGGRFPELPPTRGPDGRPTGNDEGKLRYLRWSLSEEDRLTFRGGRRYAFLVGFEEPGHGRGFTLANANRAAVPDPPALGDRHDPYPGGWGIRREGDGRLPPSMVPGAAPPADPAARERLIREALFPDGEARYRLAPTTDGYPDVDTYRDLEFYLETSPARPGR